jgi:hypothetical protein
MASYNAGVLSLRVDAEGARSGSLRISVPIIVSGTRYPLRHDFRNEYIRTCSTPSPSVHTPST